MNDKWTPAEDSVVAEDMKLEEVEKSDMVEG